MASDKPAKQWSEMTKKEKRMGIITLIVIAFIVISIVNSASGGTKSTDVGKTADATSSTDSSSQGAAKVVAEKPAERQITGIATTLGTGTFTGGTDVVAGLYDVTTVAGQSGNFMVSGTDSYNDILGDNSSFGVPKVRAQISTDDSIKISGLSSVIFTPVIAPFVTGHIATDLYAGTFTVGQDVGAGRYVATTTSGSSGNFMVSGSNSVNEILGNASSFGVPSVTFNIAVGDIINISGLSRVILTPSN